MRALAATAILVACSGDPRPAIDAASGVDGAYTCVTQHSASGSCDGPLFDPSIQAQWPLALAGGAITITSVGFDTATIGCTGGAWNGTEFECAASWRRAGRLCTLALHLRQQPAGSLVFWVGPSDASTALCTR